MHALTRIVTVAAAVLPLLWISVAFSQTPPAPLDPTIPRPAQPRLLRAPAHGYGESRP